MRKKLVTVLESSLIPSFLCDRRLTCLLYPQELGLEYLLGGERWQVANTNRCNTPMKTKWPFRSYRESAAIIMNLFENEEKVKQVEQLVPASEGKAFTAADHRASQRVPVSVILAVRNEAVNLPRCLAALGSFAEVWVIDSQSTDETVAIAEAYGCRVVQFHYAGGWPKKRQWAMENLPLGNEWVFLLDADEEVTPELAQEMQAALQNADGASRINGFYVPLQLWFLGRQLRWGDSSFDKLSLLRRSHGRYECRLAGQDASMADMEVHEHVVVEGATGRLHNALVHHNYQDLSRYIQKHDEYSNWEARVLLGWAPGPDGEAMPAKLWGTQAQRRRWLKARFFRLPGSPLGLFIYRYFLRLGLFDGIPGLLYCGFQAIQMFHTKAKIYELQRQPRAGA